MYVEKKNPQGAPTSQNHNALERFGPVEEPIHYFEKPPPANPPVSRFIPLHPPPVGLAWLLFPRRLKSK